MFSTDLARDLPCGRNNCWPCNTSKEGRVKNCKARSILYETNCTLCNQDDPVRQPNHQEESQRSNKASDQGLKNVADPSPHPRLQGFLQVGSSPLSQPHPHSQSHPHHHPQTEVARIEAVIYTFCTCFPTSPCNLHCAIFPA